MWIMRKTVNREPRANRTTTDKNQVRFTIVILLLDLTLRLLRL